MQIKVFKEHTAKEAMDKVKKELGPDAVILHTRKYSTGGIFGYGGKKMVEVTAAIEDQQSKRMLSPVKIWSKGTDPAPEQQSDTKQQSSTNATQSNNMVPKSVLKNYKAADFHPATSQKKINTNLAQKAPAEKTEVIKNTAKTDNKKKSDTELKQQKKIDQLEHELAKMKVVLSKVVDTQTEAIKDGSNRRIVSLSEALQEQEVNENIRKEILSSGDSSLLTDKNSDYAHDVLLGYLKKCMPDSAGIRLEEGKSKIVAFIGTTGVGKTTTLAKIASRFVLEQGLHAVLITADTYRISAVEQLKTYSDIIGIPLETVYTQEELNDAIKKHSDKQLILIDTAGRSQHNDYQLNELHELLDVNADIEKHLVLSTTTKYKDMKDIIRKFSLCAPDKVIFTKTDETSGIGVILNLLKEYPLTLSYFTNGQSVPDDIFPAQPKNLADLLLR